MGSIRCLPVARALLLGACAVSGARAQTAADPCVRCDVMYAVDCGIGLWAIDLRTGTSVLIASMTDSFYDLAVTSDGRLVGVNAEGVLRSISACDGTITPLAGPSVGNGLTGYLDNTDLLAQGPPLVRVDSTGLGTSMTIGGAVGLAPPDWCGSSMGDLAISPVDGLLRTALGCTCVTGATDLEIVDPATGAVLRDAGCLLDGAGNAYVSVYGLAYDSTALWGVEGTFVPQLLRIDPETALVVPFPIGGGFACGNGLACLPCTGTPDPCSQVLPPPPGIGAALRVTNAGDPYAADITCTLSWAADEGAPRPGNVHFHVMRSLDPRALAFVPDPERLFATSYDESTPAAPRLPLVHFYLVHAADDCERVSTD